MIDRQAVDWEKTGTVFNIQRYSLHDGPGIRSIVFLKGCGLRCRWCSNPESHRGAPQVMFLASNCIGCGLCERVCPAGAVVREEAKKVRILPEKCTHCGACARVCVAEALVLKGKTASVREVFTELEKDGEYYRRSGGGITLSGGEALLQPDFAAELFKAARQAGWSTAVETALFVREEAVRAVMPYTDLFLADFKLFDEADHKKFTGQSNETIKRNIRNICAQGGNVILRVPLIPGVNDSADNLRKTAAFAGELGTVKEIDLLPYHRLGAGKYEQLGRKYTLEELRQPSAQALQAAAALLENCGFRVKIGG